MFMVPVVTAPLSVAALMTTAMFVAALMTTAMIVAALVMPVATLIAGVVAVTVTTTLVAGAVSFGGNWPPPRRCFRTQSRPTQRTHFTGR